MGRTKIATHIAELHRHLHEAEKNRQLILSKIGALKDSCLKAEISYVEYQKRLSTPVSGKSLTEWVHYYDSYIKLCQQHIESLHRQHKKQTYTKYFLLAFSAIFLIFFLKSNFTGFVISDQDTNYNTYTQEINHFFTENTQIPFTQENAGEILGVSFSGKLYGEGNAKIYFNDILISDINSKSTNEVSAFRGLTGFVIGEGESSDSESSDSQEITSPNSHQQAPEDSPSHTSTTSEPAETNNPQTNSEEGSESESLTETQPSQSQQQPEEATPIESPSHTPTQAAETNISEDTNPTLEENETIEEPEQSGKEYSFTFLCNVDCDLLQYSIEQLEHVIRVELDGVNLSLENIKYTVPKEFSDNATIINETISLESPIVIEEPVQWKKEITLDKPGEVTVELPSEAKSISATSTDDSNNSETVEINNKIKTTSESGDNIQQVTLSGDSDSYEVLYETQAPKVTEDLVSQTQKEITISAPDELNYTNVVSFTDLPHPMHLEEVNKIKLYWEVNGTNIEHPFTVNDTDNDGLVDRLQWITPHLSEQKFTIIIITKAEHLDSGKEFIADIYDSVKELDGIWSQTINDSEYVRVTFEQKLTNKNDITLYPRIVSGTPSIEVYEIDGSTMIVNFTSLNENTYNKLFLTNLQSPEQSVFDLKVVGGAVEFDHIIDPTPKTLPAGRREGMLVTSNATSQFPNYFMWNGSNWSARADALSIGGLPEWLTVRAGVTRDEYILISADNQDDINIQMNFTNSSGQRCWGNGTACNVVWEVNTTSTTADVQKADVAYSYLNGNALAVWTDNSRRPMFTVWNGTFWSRPRAINDTPSNIGTLALTGANIETVQLIARTNNSNEIALLLSDSNDDSEVITWNGTGFDCESPVLSIALGTTDVQKIDGDYEDLSGDLFVASISSATSVNITTKAAGTCTFVTTSRAVNNAEYIDVAGQSGTNNIMLAGATGGGTDDIDAQVWRGAAWGNISAEDTSDYANAASPNQFFAAAWAGLRAGVMVYSDAANNMIDYYLFNTTTMAWQGNPSTDVTPTPAFSGTGEDNIRAYSFIDENKTLAIFKDANLTHAKLWAKIYNSELNRWENTETGQQPLIINASATITHFPTFDFTWQRFITAPARDISYPANTTYNVNVSMINYTRTGAAYCWYSTNGGATNSSPSSTCSNFTNVVSAQGSNTWILYANDSLGVWESDNVTFFMDTILPTIQFGVRSEGDDSYISRANIFVNVTANDTNLMNMSIFLYNSSMNLINQTNKSGSPNYLNTSGLADGVYYFNASVNDSVGNWNYSDTYTVTIDRILPKPAITYPQNTTYNVNVSMLNYTFTEINPGFCWYTRDSGVTNSSLVACGTNFSNVISVQGSNNWRLYMNDSAGNLNMTNITFFMDTILPTIQFGVRTTGNDTDLAVGNIFVNVTVNDTNLRNISIFLYNSSMNLVNQTNKSTNPAYLNTSGLIDGIYYFNASVNDSVGNWNYSSTYVATVDRTFPKLAISYPTNTTYNLNVSMLNYTFTEINPGFCWYSTNAGVTNSSLVNCGTNFTNIVSAQGSNNWRLYMNDSAGNLNMTNITFFMDTILPTIQFGVRTTTNNSNLSVRNIFVNITVNDTNLMNISIFLYNSSMNIVNQTNKSTNPAYLNTSAMADGVYYFNASVNDSVGNWNYSDTYRVTVDTTLPAPRITDPLNTTYNSNISRLNYTFTEINPGFCWYTRDSGVTNSSLVACGTNFSNVISVQGSNNWRLYMNDSAGNLNMTNITFFLDTLIPTVAFGIGTEVNASTVARTNIVINVTANDTNLKNITIRLYNVTMNLVNETTTLTSPNFANITGLPNGIYQFNATVFDNVGNVNYTETRNVTLANSPPQITRVFSIPDQTIIENSVTKVLINFTVQDADGYANINTTTARINLTRTGETTVRQNSTCIRYEQGGILANYTCSLDIWYFDSAGEWNISAFISDMQISSATNMSTNLTILQTSSFVVGPSRVAFANLPPASTNQTATNDPLVINNTGNKPITAGNIQINATNLVGETDPSRALYAGNFSVGTATGSNNECGATGATAMVNNAFTSLSGATLPKGNNSVNDGTTAQEQLYVCIKQIGSELTAQSYSTSNQGSWTIKILIVSLSLRRKKKLKEDRLFKIMMLLTEEVKEKHSPKNQEMIKIVLQQLAEKYDVSTVELKEMMVNSLEIEVPVSIFSSSLGALEALSLYLKDNKNLRFKDIASVLQRNEKTVWTAHHMATEKKVQLSEAAGLSVPVKVLGKPQLTIFESLVTYLKDRKNMKYSEIGELLSRDQRNIWTIYNRAIKKTDDKKTIVTLE